MKQCPVEGCQEWRADDHLMCLWHWRKVPRDLQQKVVLAYARLRNCRSGRMLERVVKAYKSAATAAIAAATKKAA